MVGIIIGVASCRCHHGSGDGMKAVVTEDLHQGPRGMYKSLILPTREAM